MKRILLLSLPLAFLAACGPVPKKGCKETGCGAGSVCNTNTGNCEVLNQGGGGGTMGGGAGGGSGGGAGGGGGGGNGDGGVDAGPAIDPFDDGGVFEPGDICNYAIPVHFDGGVAADGGAATVVTLTVDLTAMTSQYKGDCNTSSGDSNDVVFEVKLTEPKGLIITATDTSGKSQDPVLSLLTAPCPLLASAACVDTGSDPEVLSLERVPAGTYYVLLENWAADNLGDGTYDVQFELVDPTMGPPNDTCATAETITFTNGAAMASGTTAGAFNDTGGKPLTCSTASARNPDVFYTFTLTQPQDVTVTVDTPSGSTLTPAISITNTCGVGGAGNQHGCATGAPATLVGRSLAAGTYFLVVDGNGSSTGDFTLALTLSPPTPLPMNDTCAMPTTLTPSVSQMVDANLAAKDYTFTCAGGARGGDVVYQFTTTMAQKVTITATGMSLADAVISLRGMPCDDNTNEVDCVDSTVDAPEVLTANNVPAGTWYVVLGAYGAANGQFGLALALDAPVLPPANDTCASPATLMPNVSQTIDLAAANADYDQTCSFNTIPDAVYQFTTTQPQRATLIATPVGASDAVLSIRDAPCDTAVDLLCFNDTQDPDPEVLVINTLPAGTHYVMLGADGTGTSFGLSLTLEPPHAAPANDSCTAPDVVTLTGGMAMRSIDLFDATADIASDGCATSAAGADVVYQVTIAAMQTLTVEATPVGGVDSVLFAKGASCSGPTITGVCVDSAGRGAAETLDVPNVTSSPMIVFVVLKSYYAGSGGVVNVTFTSM